MNNKIKLSVDHTTAREGDYVVVSWDCGMPDSVTLTINNGYSTSRLQLADSGSRSILIEKSKGKTTLLLTAAQGTSKQTRELSIKVKNIKPIRAKAYRPRQQRPRSARELWHRVTDWWRAFCAKMSYAWRTMPPRQKRLYKITLLLLAMMWAGSLSRNAGFKAGYEQALRDRQQIESEHHSSAQPQDIDTYYQ